MNYLNTRPLLYGIRRSELMEEIELYEDYPSKVAGALLSGEIDLGLVPVAIIPKLNQHYIVSDYCIGCDGEVASVCLFSEVPLEEVTEVLLDYQSRTSVELTKILLKEYWKVQPTLVAAKSDFREQIKGSTAGLVIGDRSLEQRSISPYIYDLGLAWKSYTGLPFVFAAWISNKPMKEDFIRRFNEANALGLSLLPQVIEEISCKHIDLQEYYTRHIQYELDDAKKSAMNLFVEKVGKERTMIRSLD